MAASLRPYPWRLGATSFVVPAELMTNARLLVGRVDDVQLLFFESVARSRLPHGVDVDGLLALAGASGLSYTVHLPTDIRLGAADPALRQEGIDEICRLVNTLAPLAPSAFDLHLLPESALAPAAWLANLERSLAFLAGELGEAREGICIENIDYPCGPVFDIAVQYGFSLCLDVGHLLRYGHDWRAVVARYLGSSRHLHYHGVIGGRDHGAVAKEQGEVTAALGDMLRDHRYDGVVTLEMYDLEQLTSSLAELDRLWGARCVPGP
ncbi:MAG: TIM barrel protein [Desulfobulbaceae bacterium]|nr:TIM barrel protein [Desulfobulbaceae bacterium]